MILSEDIESARLPRAGFLPRHSSGLDFHFSLLTALSVLGRASLWVVGHSDIVDAAVSSSEGVPLYIASPFRYITSLTSPVSCHLLSPFRWVVFRRLVLFGQLLGRQATLNNLRTPAPAYDVGSLITEENLANRPDRGCR